MTDDPNPLGEYLRARRELVTPDLVGIPVLGVRRVAGLRREEVAMLAGVSADYYLRLEQGRDRNPSTQVLESIARVLRLDENATTYLLGLASGSTTRPRRRPRKRTVPIGIATLIDTIGLPAFVEDRYFDVLAANSLAAAVSPCLRPGQNRLRDVFLDDAERALYPQSQRAAESLIAGFRRSVGGDTDDPRFIEVVGELSLASPEFRQLWARHDVGVLAGAKVTLDHPQVGELTLFREKLGIGESGGMMLVIYSAEPGSPDAEKLSFLASMTVEASR